MTDKKIKVIKAGKKTEPARPAPKASEPETRKTDSFADFVKGWQAGKQKRHFEAIKNAFAFATA